MDAIALRGFTLGGKAVAKGAAIELPIEQFNDLRAAGLVELPPAEPARASQPAAKPKAGKAS